MKFKVLGVLLLSVLVLGACDDGNSENGEDVNVDSKPGEVSDYANNDSVSDDVSSKLNKLITELPHYTTKAGDFANQLDDSPSLIKTVAFKQEFSDFLLEYESFIKSLDANPKTDADLELTKLLNDFTFETQMYIEQMRLYIKLGSYDYRANANDHIIKRKISANELVNKMEEYGIVK